MIRYLRAALTVTLSLYAIGTLTTMAGMEIFGWLSATIVLGSLLFMRKKLELRTPILTNIDYALFALCAVIIASAYIAAPADADHVFIAGNSRFVALFLLLRVGLEIISPRRAETLLPWLIGLVAVIGAYAVFQNATGIDLVRGTRNPIAKEIFGGVTTYRARGMWDHPVRFGHSIALSLCFPIAYILSGYFRSARKPSALLVVCILATTLAGAGLFFSFTRGAWIGLAAAIFGMSVYAGWKYVLKVALLGTLVVGAILISSPELRGRFESLTQPRTDGSSTARVDIWRANIEMFKDHPVLGVGYGVNEDLITEYYERLGITQQDGGHAHNNFIQFLSGTGLLGFLSYMVFSIFALILTHRSILASKRSGDTFLYAVSLAALGAQLVIHIGGLTECSFKSAQINHQYFLILALLVSLARSPIKPIQPIGGHT
jgi:O-antigen ligase